MKINDQILDLLNQNQGIITTNQIENLGYSRTLISKYVKADLLERVRQGVYVLPNAIPDDTYILMLSSEHIIFSHESALFFHGLSDRTPFIHSVTIPSNASIPLSIKDDCKCYYSAPDLYHIGETSLQTTFGNKVRCYDAERTICDLIRSRNRIDEETFITSLKNYAVWPDKNLHRLAEYAKAFSIERKLKSYMEVML